MKENRYYVYLHKIASTGEVFYVGKGQRSRLTSTDRRNTTWNAIVSEKEWFAEKYMDNLSSDEAATLEVKLIAELAPVANFHKKDVRPRALNKADFESLYYYCENSKSGLRFKRDGLARSSKGRFKAGDEAGTKLSTGYYSVQLNGKNYMAHRVVWVLLNGSIGREIIDHKDKNRSNNKIENLRLVTHSINGKNSSIRSHNKTGYSGVSFTRKFNIYSATWSTDNGEPQMKHFSATKYGKDLALALAVEYRHRKTLELSTYTPDESYTRLPALTEYSEEQIFKMFECNLVASNTSGISGVYLANSKGSDFWVHAYGESKKNFSCTKHGYEKAKSLAIEHKYFIENSLPIGEVSLELREEIQNPNNANNASGIRGISFIGVNRDIILAQCTFFGKGLAKRFDTKLHGLLPSIKMALEWRENIKKEKSNARLSPNPVSS